MYICVCLAKEKAGLRTCKRERERSSFVECEKMCIFNITDRQKIFPKCAHVCLLQSETRMNDKEESETRMNTKEMTAEKLRHLV